MNYLIIIMYYLVLFKVNISASKVHFKKAPFEKICEILFTFL